MSTTKSNNSLKDLFRFGCSGVLIGFLVIILAEARISYNNIRVNRHGLFNHFNAGTETQYLLGKAAYASFKGESENVVTSLASSMNKFTNRMEAAEAYFYLGSAELNLGHPQLAAGYFELMYANNPTAHGLFVVAISYDQGGNLDQALEKYTLFVSFQDGTTQANEVSHAQQRIQEIMTIKGLVNPNQ